MTGIGLILKAVIQFIVVMLAIAAIVLVVSFMAVSIVYFLRVIFRIENRGYAEYLSEIVATVTRRSRY